MIFGHLDTKQYRKVVAHKLRQDIMEIPLDSYFMVFLAIAGEINESWVMAQRQEEVEILELPNSWLIPICSFGYWPIAPHNSYWKFILTTDSITCHIVEV